MTYISEAQLQAPAIQRRKALQHYLFNCGCERCEAQDAQDARPAPTGDHVSAQSEEGGAPNSEY